MDFQGMHTRQLDRRMSLNFSTDLTAVVERTGEEPVSTAHRGDPPT